MSTIDASYASSRDLALLSNIFVPSYTYDPTKNTFQVQLDTYLQGTVNIGSSNTDYKFNINGNPYVQVTVSDWAKAPAIATVDMSAYRITQLGNQVESDNTRGLPALSFYNDASTGIYSDGPGRVGILSQSVSALMVTARGISNLSNTSNSIGGVTLSGSQIITGYAVSNNVGGVTLSSGSITTVYGSRANINGVLLDRDRVFTIFDASSYIAGVTLSSGTITAGDGGSIGGVSLSGTRINATGASIVGGVSLSSGTISATNPTNNHYIGNVRIQGNNIYGVLTSGSIVALDNPYGTSNKGGGIQFWNGKLLVNTSDTTIPVGQFNVSMGDAPSMSATTATWSSSYALFGADVTSATGAALGLGYDKTNGVARIVSAQPGSGALKDMVITARNLSLAVTQLTVCGAIVNPSASVSSIGGVSLTNSLVGGVSISSGGILSPNSNVVNTIGGVILSNQKVTAQIIDTGSTNTATSVVGRVTLADGNITAPGTNSVISGVTLNNGKIIPSNVTWVAIGTNAGSSASNSVAIGTAAGNASQQPSSIAIGSNAGTTSQGSTLAPGATVTGNAIAIGQGAGATNQGASAVAIGGSVGATNQKFGSVAIGNNAANTEQGIRSVAIGDHTANLNQSGGAVAIGTNAGRSNQGGYSIAIGTEAGSSNQSSNSIVLNATGGDLAITGTRNYRNTSGFFVAPIRQSTDTANASDVDVIAWNPLTKEMFSAKNGGATLGGVAFSSETIVAGTGTSSIGGVTMSNGFIVPNRGTTQIAIGSGAGAQNQYANSVAIGTGAGSNFQNFQGVAIGYNAANSSQGAYSVAIGNVAGKDNQGQYSVAIGHNTASLSQGTSAIAMGFSAGANRQGGSSIAIGAFAGVDDQVAKSIILNATEGQLDAKVNSGFYVAPIRAPTDAGYSVLGYNTTTKEIVNVAGAGTTIGGVGVSSAGALTGVTTIAASGLVTASNIALNSVPSETTNTNVLSYNPVFKTVSYTGKYVQGVTGTGAGISVTTGQNPVITNTGVTSIVAGTGITISPGGTGAVTINATTAGTVSSVTSANANITVANTTTTPVLTLSPNLNVTTIQAGTGSSAIGGVTLNAGALTNVTSISAGGTSYVGGVTLSGGQITATGALSTIGPLSITSESTTLLENTGSGSGGWVSVASSADGQTIFGVRNAGTTIYISRNRSITWVNNTSLTNGFWSTVACSSNGQVVVATQNTGGIGYPSAVFISTNGGSTWSAGTQPGGSVNYTASAVSGDGSIIIVGVNGGGVYRITSADSFTAWTRLDSTINRNWTSLAVSTNGSTYVGTANGIYTAILDPTNAWVLNGIASTFGSISLSSDGTKGVAIESNYLYVLSGGTWYFKPATAATTWSSSKYSADGTTIVATTNTGSIYKSLDAGASLTLIRSGVANAWSSVACSSDGTKIVASQSSGYIWFNYIPASLVFTSQATIGGVTLRGSYIIPNFTSGQIAIGSNAGITTQGYSAVAIGYNAGYTNQSDGAVAIGFNAGSNTQGINAIAIGTSAGPKNQATRSIAIGVNSGGGSPPVTGGLVSLISDNAVCIGAEAGYAGAGQNCVFLGYRAGRENLNNSSDPAPVSKTSNVIIINATGDVMSNAAQTTTSGLFVAPIRNDTTSTSLSPLAYNNTTKEIVTSSVAGFVSGMILMFTGASPPTGWAFCNGNNGTPNLTDKFIICSGSTYPAGTTGGSSSVTLATTNLPAHSHTLTNGTATVTATVTTVNGGTGGTGIVNNQISRPSSESGNSATATISGRTDSVGSGTAFSIMPPYYALAYIMKL
jgi:microcystin-dependent protein